MYASYAVTSAIMPKVHNGRLRPTRYLNPTPEYVLIKKCGNLKFKEDVMVRRQTIEDGFVALEYNGLNIYTVGATLNEAKRSFWQDVTHMWRSYAKADDNTLTEDAKVLKRKLLAELVEV